MNLKAKLLIFMGVMWRALFCLACMGCLARLRLRFAANAKLYPCNP